MVENYQVRSCSLSRTPKSCSTEGITDEFILVDDDDVIILDFPESSKLKPSDTLRNQKKSPSSLGVISIDDDDDYDDDDDTDNVHKPGNSVEGVSNDSGNGELNEQTSAEADDDDCLVIQEKCSVFKFSKCKQTFSKKKASSRNRFGLDSESEVSLSDSDCSDCEVLEGSSSKVREQWEKAFLKKTQKTRKASSDSSEKTRHSDIPSDTNPGIEVEHTQTSSFTSRYSDAGKESSLFPNGSETNEDKRANLCTNSRFHDEKNTQGPSAKPDEGFASSSPQETSSNGSIHRTCSKEVEEEPGKVNVQPEMLSSSKKNHMNEAAHKSGTTESSSASVDEISGLNEIEEPIFDSVPSTSGQVHDDNGTPSKMDIMLDRQKLKQTNEYKKAAKEEWESRKRQLEIQADEAQRQKKRIKLEKMRRLEMERRQKERLEEMRETQKKDEESMNMKEKVRAEVSKSLKRLEITCIDMASLLRGLGIPVGGGSFPSSDAVRSAYKRAVLTFHPDRARGDLRQQVEAEEKFKLIARMKDKFESPSFLKQYPKNYSYF